MTGFVLTKKGKKHLKELSDEIKKKNPEEYTRLMKFFRETVKKVE